MLADTSDLATSSIQKDQDGIDEYLRPWWLVSMTSNFKLAPSSYIGVRFGIVSIYRLVNVAKQLSLADLSCMILSAYHSAG